MEEQEEEEEKVKSSLTEIAKGQDVIRIATADAVVVTGWLWWPPTTTSSFIYPLVDFCVCVCVCWGGDEKDNCALSCVALAGHGVFNECPGTYLAQRILALDRIPDEHDDGENHQENRIAQAEHCGKEAPGIIIINEWD